MLREEGALVVLNVCLGTLPSSSLPCSALKGLTCADCISQNALPASFLVANAMEGRRAEKPWNFSLGPFCFREYV